MDASGQLSDSERKQLEGQLGGVNMVVSDSKSGTMRIAAERASQLNDHGYLPEGDVGRVPELVMAAQSYIALFQVQYSFGIGIDVTALPAPNIWPWHERYWKPSSDIVENLTKAGALAAAAIDAIQEERGE